MDREGQHALYGADVLTGETAPIFKVRDRDIGSFDLLPGGNALVYASEGRFQTDHMELGIVVRDLESGDERDLYRVALQGPGPPSQVLLSPDGETVAFVQRSVRPNQEDPDALYLLPVTGGELRELLRGHLWKVAWMPDGESLLLRAFRDQVGSTSEGPPTHLLRVDAESGEVFDAGLEMEGIGHLALSPDGRRLAFADGRSIMEVWVMEDFLPRQESRVRSDGGQR
jgi:hypothetical protein